MSYSKSSMWSTGLFDCTDDVSSCCCTYWCPCVTFGRIANVVSEGRTSCCVSGTCFVLLHISFMLEAFYSWYYRLKLKEKYSMESDPCYDCCVSFFCQKCSLCQQYRELQNRGFDMSKGWEGNAATRTPPVVEGGMMR